MSEEPFAQFKQRQREMWSHFAPIEAFTTPTAAHLVRCAGVTAGQRVLDVGTGTGVAAITAARLGAQVVGVDLTPPLLERARQNAQIAGLSDITWQEGDAEALPFADASFDTVVSQFGHMFAPRAELALSELLRVLKPGGTLAFSTWPPEHFVGRFFVLTASFAPPPPPGMTPPPSWGNVDIVKARLGAAVTAPRFERGVMFFHVLSPEHYVRLMEETVGPARALAQSGDAELLERYRAAVRALVSEYLEDNRVRQDYLVTCAQKL